MGGAFGRTVDYSAEQTAELFLSGQVPWRKIHGPVSYHLGYNSFNHLCKHLDSKFPMRMSEELLFHWN